MLSHIRIRDFAIIEELDLELHNGLTVVTGETGAGKSIMIDAIGLVLGDRAEAGNVRHGAEKADITLTLDNSKKEIINWLKAHDLDSDEQCLLRRVITTEGRSRAYINGAPATLGMLRELGEQLVEISGQNSHQSLLKLPTQRELLDTQAGLENELKDLEKIWKQLQDYQHRLEELQNNQAEHQAKLDLLTFQLQELSSLALKENELETLNQEQTRLANADQLLQIASDTMRQLYEDDPSIYQQLSTLSSRLQESVRFDGQFKEPAELLDNALIQIQEAVDLLRNINDAIDVDPQRLAETEERLSLTHSLARKHQVDPEQLYEKWQQMEAELASLQSPEQSVEELEKKLAQTIKEYDKLAIKISKARQVAASKMNQAITEAMQTLGMEGGQFKIELAALPENERRKTGLEQIEFMVSANPGQPLKPLSKVASGGELSRISLAIQLIAAAQNDLPTLIFDEVDSGIGGAVAETVGKQLRALGKHCQVFCVTHLPQVAAQGHQHLQVVKNKQKKNTQTHLDTLDKKARVEEIARMLGGQKITPQTLAHAEEMLGASV